MGLNLVFFMKIGFETIFSMGQLWIDSDSFHIQIRQRQEGHEAGIQHREESAFRKVASQASVSGISLAGGGVF